MEKIFISIAAYRDPELLPTIKDCLENADNPNELIFCIAWQHSAEDLWDSLDQYKFDNRFKIIDIPYKEAKGVCWARAKIQEYYDGEKYYFQLDSHHRFIKGWDSELKDMLNYLRCKGFYKPILSTYLPSYFPEKDPEGRLDEVWMLNIDRFLPEGPVFIRPQGLDGWKNMKEPVFSRFLSAHFIFTLGDFVKEVPYDANFYFHGEETSLAARAYTSGWDLFNPHKIYVWHEYTREGKKKHWDDHRFDELDRNSYARFRKLFEMESDTNYENNKKEFGKYWFGNIRTLNQYERYCGLNFKNRQIHKETIYNKLPPIVGDYESGLCNKIKVCIDVWKDSLKETDYEFFAIALLNDKEEDVFRLDANKEEIERAFSENPEDKFIHFWREYEDTKQPHTWRVWPYSTSKGWCEKIDQQIKYE